MMVQLSRQPRSRRAPRAQGDESSAFWQELSIDELARVQGVAPVRDPETLWGDFWPENDSIEAFVKTLHAERHQDKK